MNKQLLFLCSILTIISSLNCPLRDEFKSDGAVEDFKTCNWQNSFTSTNYDLIYDCDGILQFGSYDQFGKNDWASTSIGNIPEHTDLQIRVTFWAIDSWDSESFWLYVDGVLAYENSYQWSSDDQKICGASNWGEREDYIDITVPHTAASVAFRFETGLNQNDADESWALSDFQVDYITADDGICADIDPTACASDVDNGYPCKLRCDFDQLTVVTTGWDYSNWIASSTETTVCDQYQIFGGYGEFASGAEATTTIYDIPAHDMLRIRFKGYFIDSWDTEKFYVVVDGNNIVEKAFQYSDGDQLCGNSNWNERFEDFDIFLAHTGTSASFIFTSSLNQGASDESWGISDFVVEYFSDSYETCESQVECPSEDDLGTNECILTCSLGQGQVDNFADQDISAWTLSETYSDDTFTTCDGLNMLGGYGIFGKNAAAEITFNDIAKHDVLSVSFRLYVGDSWDNEFFELYVDDVLVKNENFQYGEGTADVCGAGWNDQHFDISLYVGHNADSAHFKFTTTLNQNANDESWGISDFVVTYFTNYECGDVESADTCHLNPTDCSKVTVYEFCDFTGRAAEVDDVLDCVAFTPLAICIPEGITATIHDLCWYEGGTNEFTETTACMTGSVVSLLSNNEPLVQHRKEVDEDRIATVTVNY